MTVGVSETLAKIVSNSRRSFINSHPQHGCSDTGDWGHGPKDQTCSGWSLLGLSRCNTTQLNHIIQVHRWVGSKFKRTKHGHSLSYVGSCKGSGDLAPLRLEHSTQMDSEIGTNFTMRLTGKAINDIAIESNLYICLRYCI